MDGVITAVGERFEIRFERVYPRPIEAVFAALTLPERLAAWLAVTQIDPRPGGTLVLDFPDPPYRMEGEVRRLDPPRLFEFTWPEPGAAEASVVRFELAPHASGCRLTLTQTFVARDDRVSVAAGWHEHLERLAAAIDGVSTTRWDRAREAGLADHYRTLI
ncbi:MAG TPA: SRPBCC family protein [Caulobacteraceae bacterium]